MEKAGEAAKLNSLEKVRDHFAVSETLWTPNDLLTATLKLKQNVARAHFADTIQKLYEK